MGKKLTQQDFLHKIPLYRHSLYIFFATDNQKRRQLKRIFHEEVDADIYEAIVTNDGHIGNSLVVFTRWPTSPGIVAHEALHIVQRVTDHVNHELDRESSAYLLEWVVDKIMEVAPS